MYRIAADWHGTDQSDRQSGENRLYLAIIAQAAQDAIKPLEKAGPSITVTDISSARGFFLDDERFLDLASIVEAAGLPLSAAHALRAWGLDLDSRDWRLTAEEAERLIGGDGRKASVRKVA